VNQQGKAASVDERVECHVAREGLVSHAYHDEHRRARDVTDHTEGDHQCARSSSQSELLAEFRTRRFRHLSNSRSSYADPDQYRRPLPERLHQQPRSPVTRRPVFEAPHSENHVYGETRDDEIKDAADGSIFGLKAPLKVFVQKNVREKDLALFSDLSREPRPASRDCISKIIYRQSWSE
jgi:hypothetical protein